MPQKSKWFRVATEGATTDGRAIQRSWIEQMANNFNPAKYGARVWIEHLRGLLPDSAFAAQGDVLAVKAEPVEDGLLALFAQIKPLASLIAMNKAGQKLYTSIEVDPNFAGTGQAYLVGLAVTDSPASLGTELLTFAQQNPDANPLAGRKTSKDTLFTAATAFTLELEAEPSEAVTGPLAAALDKFTATITRLLGSDKPAPAAQQHSAQVPNAPDAPNVTAALTAMQDMAQAITEQHTQNAQALAALQNQFNQLQGQHQSLLTQLGTQQHGSTRPAATGGSTTELAEF